MMKLELRESDLHEVDVDGERLLFHVPTTSLFELDGVTAELLDLFREKHGVSEHDVRQRFEGRVDADDVVDALGELCDLGIVGDGGSAWRERAPMHVQATPLSTIVLNVNVLVAPDLVKVNGGVVPISALLRALSMSKFIPRRFCLRAK